MEGRKNEPVIHFADNETLQAYLKYWQHVLHLDDWYIVAAAADYPIHDQQGNRLLSDIYIIAENKEARIEICTILDDDESGFMKYCEELALLHELLHIVILIMENTDETEEGALRELHEHQKIEMLAKAFIMAKYGVDKEWFYKEG